MRTGPFPSRGKYGFPLAFMMFLIPLALYAAAADPSDPGAASIKRGKAVFLASCQPCHSLKYSGYEAKMKAENARKAFGKAAPDLNLMITARGGDHKGAAYAAALLIGYNDTPEKNSVFPNIAMPPVFSIDDPDAARKARDVTAFLADAAEPWKRESRDLGGYAVGYMALLTALLYALNRRRWNEITSRR
jgi:cytochrome c1